MDAGVIQAGDRYDFNTWYYALVTRIEVLKKSETKCFETEESAEEF